MKGSLRLSFRKGDWFAIIGVIALTIVVACFYGSLSSTEGVQMVQIYQDNQLLKEVSLNAEITIPVEGDYRNMIEISEGKVAIIASDCPGADCVHSGSISKVGRSIVCLPNKVEVRIVGEDGSTDAGRFDGQGKPGIGNGTGTTPDDEVDFIVR